MPNDGFYVHKPIAIIHTTEEQKTQCIIYEHDEPLGYQGHALAAADYIRHIANSYNVSPQKVQKRVLKELNRPTSPIRSVDPKAGKH